MTDKDDKVVDIEQVRFKQLSLDIDIPEQTTTDESNWETLKEPPKYEDLISDDAQTTKEQQTKSTEQTTELKPTTEQTTELVPKESFNVMPNTLQVAAESSMSLRNVQANLASILTSDNYVSVIAATAPEVLPDLMNSVTNAVSSADNLLIKMAQVSEKSASMQRAFEYLTRQKEQLVEAQSTLETKDEYYDESVETIKKALYKKLDKMRDSTNRTAQDYIDESDVIAADYQEVKDDVQTNESEE